MAKQTRLESFFDVVKPSLQSRATILDLPTECRIRIYEMMVPVLSEHMHLNLGRIKETEENESMYWRRHPIQCGCRPGWNMWNCDGSMYPLPPPIWPLLLVSRQFYQEACPTLYSRHHFKIAHHAPGGLIQLFRLGSLALASVSSLTIALNECKTTCRFPENDSGNCNCETCDEWNSHDDKCDCDNCLVKEGPKTPRPLGSNSRHEKTIIHEWERLCKHMAGSTKPKTLSLCFICDVTDSQTAKLILRPMHQLPRLRACSIRLSTEYSSELRLLAESTAVRLTGRDSTDSSSLSRAINLPGEIWEGILQYTDLVAPHDLEWDPKIGFVRKAVINHDPYHEGFPPPPWTTLNPCQMCLGIHKPCQKRLRFRTASDSQCLCWCFPKNLFSLNRQLREESIQVFYSRNHFTAPMTGEGARHSSKGSPFLPFIKQIPQEAIKHLRSLQLLVPPDLDFLRPGHEHGSDWSQCIKYLRKYATLARLSLTIDMSRRREYYMSHTDEDPYIMARDQRVIEPLKQLRGLKAFFVHLELPMCLYKNNRTRIRKEKETMYEQSVMGEGYDSATRGKYAHKDRWCH